MKSIFAFCMMMIFSVMAFAAPVKRLAQDVKLPTQVVLEKQAIDNPVVASATRILSGFAGATSAAAASKTSGFAAQPDVPRVLTVTPGGTTGDVEACVVTIAGTNINGATISDTFTFVADASSAVTGVKAFASVTSVSWPASCESGGFAATWSVGISDKLGLKRCMANAGDWAWSTFSGAYESTRATVTADSDEVEKNTADFTGTYDGSADFVGYYVQNYGCFP